MGDEYDAARKSVSNQNFEIQADTTHENHLVGETYGMQASTHDPDKKPESKSVAGRAFKFLEDGFNRLRNGACNKFRAIPNIRINISNPFKSKNNGSQTLVDIRSISKETRSIAKEISDNDALDFVQAGSNKNSAVQVLIKSSDGQKIFKKLCQEKNCEDYGEFMLANNKFAKATSEEERKSAFLTIQKLLPKIANIEDSKIIETFDFSDDEAFQSKIDQLTSINEQLSPVIVEQLNEPLSKLQEKYQTKFIKNSLKPENFMPLDLVDLLLQTKEGRADLEKICESQKADPKVFKFLVAQQDLKEASTPKDRFERDVSVKSIAGSLDPNKYPISEHNKIPEGVYDDNDQFDLYLIESDRIKFDMIVSLNLQSNSPIINELRKKYK